jgi:hypothetical protein
VRSLKYGRLRVEVEGYYLEQGKKESYPKGSGYMVLQRPSWILMNITNPLTHSTVAAMAANGEIFQLFIPSENKYLTGAVDVEAGGDSPFYQIRPQHVAEAILVPPLMRGSEQILFVNEDAEGGALYYVISELNNASAVPFLIRRLWVERSALRLTRQQSYLKTGELASDVRYGSEVSVGGLPIFSEVNLYRPLDRYRLSFSFEPESVKVNEPVEESAFVVVRPPGAELMEVKERPKR